MIGSKEKKLITKPIKPPNGCKGLKYYYKKNEDSDDEFNKIRR